MGCKTLGFEVGAGLELLFEELADDVEVIGTRELGDGDGEGDAVEVGVGSEESRAADLKDFVGVLLGLEEGEGGTGFLLRGEWGCGVRG